MKIASYEASILLVREDDPLANMPEEAGRKRPIVTVRLRTDSGIEGIGVTLYGGRLTRSLHAAVEDLAAATVGEDPQRVEAIVAKLRTGDPGGGPGGIFTLALSAIDTALWDIKGKALDQPLWKLLGGHRRGQCGRHLGPHVPVPAREPRHGRRRLPGDERDRHGAVGYTR